MQLVFRLVQLIMKDKADGAKKICTQGVPRRCERTISAPLVMENMRRETRFTASNKTHKTEGTEKYIYWLRQRLVRWAWQK